jgi:hypothetical protein
MTKMGRMSRNSGICCHTPEVRLIALGAGRVAGGQRPDCLRPAQAGRSSLPGGKPGKNRSSSSRSARTASSVPAANMGKSSGSKVRPNSGTPNACNTSASDAIPKTSRAPATTIVLPRKAGRTGDSPGIRRILGSAGGRVKWTGGESGEQLGLLLRLGGEGVQVADEPGTIERFLLFQDAV